MLCEEVSEGIIGALTIVGVVDIPPIELETDPTLEIIFLEDDMAVALLHPLIPLQGHALILPLCPRNGMSHFVVYFGYIFKVIMSSCRFIYRRRNMHDTENDSMQGNEGFSRMNRRRYRKSRSVSSRSRSTSRSISNRSLSNRDSIPPRRDSYSNRGSAIRRSSGQGDKSPPNSRSSECCACRFILKKSKKA